MKLGSLKLFRPVLFFALSVGLSATLIGCAYVTGEAIKLPTQSPVLTNVSPVQADELIRANKGNARFIILDVRTPSEYAYGHIPKAINLDFNLSNFKEEASRLDKNSTYLVYCQSGSRSTAASKILSELGLRNIFNMTGGITAWLTSGLPMIK
jgi:rhodanese-related sulfurtransferase